MRFAQLYYFNFNTLVNGFFKSTLARFFFIYDSPECVTSASRYTVLLQEKDEIYFIQTALMKILTVKKQKYVNFLIRQLKGITS